MRDDLLLGKDFEIVSEKMWKLLCKCFPGDVSHPPNPLIRSFERIGLGMRTQIEYFYQKFEVKFLSNDPEMLQFKQSGEPNSTFHFYYSALRNVDSLKFRILTLLRDQLAQPKLSLSKLRFFCQVKGQTYSLEFVGQLSVQSVLTPDANLLVTILDANG